MDDLLQQGIAAAEAGDRTRARQILSRVVEANPHSEKAWLWLSGAVESGRDRLSCLDRVLEINPDNEIARHGMAMLKQQQVSQPTKMVESPPGEAKKSPQLFDLNIEEVLENWEVAHAIREVIANALDEQVISRTHDIQIFKDSQGDWHIRDFGRGLRIDHFTLNEDEEKLSYPSGIIGKFGVGLKDALATFNRRGVVVLICSSYGTYRLREAQKHNFGTIVTLHVEYDDTPTGTQGTEFILHGVTDSDMTQAKSLFLKFSGEQVLETTRYGQILRRQGDSGRVYITGVFASEEANFLFSYNITSLTNAMRKRLNRERLNVGRTTYAERVKMILKSAKSKVVQDLLADQVFKRSTGDQCDEMQWIEISRVAMNLTHERRQVAYVTEQELQARPNVIDNIRSDDYQVVVISDCQKAKLDEQIRTGGPQVRTLETYIREYHESFQYKFVEPAALTSQERRVFDLTPKLLALVGVTGSRAPRVRVSETMRVTNDHTGGVWDAGQQAIIIRRSQLASPVAYAGTLLHEVGHATTGTVDATREFEQVLTQYLGRAATAAVR